MSDRMKLKTFAKSIGWTLYVLDIDGVEYVTDTYWMMPMKDSLAAEYLTHWNLSGPGHYENTDGRLSRIGDVPSKTADSAKAILEKPGTVELSLPLVDGLATFIRVPPYGHACAVAHRPDGTVVRLRQKYLRIVAGEEWAAETLKQAGGPNDPVWVGNGLLMPVRKHV